MKFRDSSINNNKLLAPFYSIMDIELKPLIDEEALNYKAFVTKSNKRFSIECAGNNLIQFVDRRDRARHKTNNLLSIQ